MSRILLSLFIVLAQFASAQQNGWGAWQTIYTDNNLKAEVQFYISNNSCDQGGKSFKYRTRITGDLRTSLYYINWKFDYKDCNGISYFQQQGIEIGNSNGGRVDELMAESMDSRFTAMSLEQAFYDVNLSSYPMNKTGINPKPLTPAEIQEKKTWDTAFNNPTIENINEYTSQYPNGKYNKEASVLLKQLADKQEEREIRSKTYKISDCVPNFANKTSEFILSHIERQVISQNNNSKSCNFDITYKIDEASRNKTDYNSGCSSYIDLQKIIELPECKIKGISVQASEVITGAVDVLAIGTCEVEVNKRKIKWPNDLKLTDGQKAFLESKVHEQGAGNYEIKYVFAKVAVQSKTKNIENVVVRTIPKPAKIVGGPSNAFLSVLLPGLGNIGVDQDKPLLPWYFVTGAFLGSAYLTYSYKADSDKYYDLYHKATIQSEIDDAYEKANDNYQSFQVMAGVTGAIWLGDIIYVVIKGFKNRSEQLKLHSNNGTNMKFYLTGTGNNLQIGLVKKF